MTIFRSFGNILDKLKLSLRAAVCCICRGEDLPDTKTFVCEHCTNAIQLRDNTAVEQVNGAHVYSACDFPQQIKQWLYQLKFDQRKEHSLRLTEILLHYWYQLELDASDEQLLVVPIPCHRPHRDSEQQGNHLNALFQPFASELGVNYIQGLLSWARPVHPQHALYGKKLRQENVRDSFAIDTRALKDMKPPLHLLVVDDILTTGATMTEAIQALQEAFPETRITGLTLCHLPLGQSR